MLKLRILSLTALLLLLSLPAWSIQVKHLAGTGRETWALKHSVQDGTIGAVFSDWCGVQAGTGTLLGNGCAEPVDTIFTSFSATVQRNLNSTTEEGTVFLVIGGVRNVASDIIIGTDTTAVCDVARLGGASVDINQAGESCRINLSISVPAGTPFQIGFDDISVQETVLYHLRGVYDD